jgi:hypothetical protein
VGMGTKNYLAAVSSAVEGVLSWYDYKYI